MTREEMRELARRNVATWPPLTAEERDRLYVLLAPMRAWLRENATDRQAGAS
jgi:hypothetical protein